MNAFFGKNVAALGIAFVMLAAIVIAHWPAGHPESSYELTAPRVAVAVP